MAEFTDQPAYSRSDSLVERFRKTKDRRLDPGSKRMIPALFVRGAHPAGGGFFQRVAWRFWEWGSTQAGRLLSNVQIDDIRMRLLRAGFPMGLKATQFAFLKWVMTGLFMMLFFICIPVVAIALNMEFPWFVYAASPFMGALYGFKAPDIWLAMKTRQRQFEIQLALPDMIDLITVSVEAGLGLGAAIHRVSSRFVNPLSEEFMRTMQEVHLGRSQADSMRDMARRIDVPDLTTFLMSLVQAEQLGLAIANVLRVQSDRLREKRSQRAREQAQKAPIKMIFPLVFFIFPALFVVILGPALISFMRQSML
jgi:tight adherence protein C